MRIFSVLSLTFLLLFSCDTINKFDTPASTPLTEEQTISLLSDLIIAETIIKESDTIKLNEKKQKYYDQIFTDHKVSKKDFDSSLYYYSNKYNESSDIYEKVLSSIKKKEIDYLK